MPATLFATGYYEFLLRDSLQKISKGHAQHEHGEEGLVRHLTKISTADEVGVMNATEKDRKLTEDTIV